MQSSFSFNNRNGIARYHVVQVARPSILTIRKGVLEVHRFEAIKADERVSMEMDVTIVRGPCDPLVKRRHFDAGFNVTNHCVMDRQHFDFISEKRSYE
jgi:hypothetical protein